MFVEGYHYDVDPSGCWIWKLAVSDRGYPLVKVSRSTQAAHRIAYEQAHGSIPDGWHVHHDCHNRRCVNREHLTALAPRAHADLHRRDKAKKLTADDARAIRVRAFNDRASTTTIAAEFGVSERWGDLEDLASKRPHPCAVCGEPIPADAHRNKRTCSGACRTRLYRTRIAA